MSKIQAQQTTVLVVDDDPDLLRLMTLRLEAAGYRVLTAQSGEEALSAMAAAHPRLVITDLRMAGMDGMALFEAIHAAHPTLPVIILTAHGSISDAVAATRQGVFGYLSKPFDGQALLREVNKAIALAGPPDSPMTDEPWRNEILTRSPLMEEILSRVRLAASTDAGVLIQGESGTGKELLAQAIHRASHRASGPFVAINCGAIPEQLLESELFGHVKGAFTGASRDHVGLFQAAAGGTLFLDEIGDMPAALQMKLLRALQEKEIRPVGATRTFRLDVRILCATHRDLEAEIAAGRFREDLYYRLKVIALKLPPLAERREDIPLLAGHFLSTLARQHGKPVHGLSPEAMELLIAAAWPGNIRQLYHVIEQSVILSSTPIISATLVENAIQREKEHLASFDEARKSFEKRYLSQLLRTTDGNVTQAAKLAKRNRTEFYKLLQRHQLDPGLFKRSKDEGKS